MSAGPSTATMLRAVAFDFDGVILESTDIKRRAFLDLFADRPELHAAILGHHLENLGVSRFAKFEWIYRRLLGRPITAEESAELGRRYSKLVLSQTLVCPLVPGAERLLAELGGRVPAFVVSATPQAELELIVERRGLGSWFRELHGSPPGKGEILADLLARHGLAAPELLMVGDGVSDFHAARTTGVPFVRRRTAEQDAHFAQHAVESVDDLDELRPLLAARLPAKAR